MILFGSVFELLIIPIAFLQNWFLVRALPPGVPLRAPGALYAGAPGGRAPRSNSSGPARRAVRIGFPPGRRAGPQAPAGFPRFALTHTLQPVGRFAKGFNQEFCKITLYVVLFPLSWPEENATR